MRKRHTGRSLTVVQKYFPDVKSIVDGHRPIVLTVTNKHVTRGVKRDPKNCPAALAVNELRPKPDGALVHKHVAYIVRGDTAERYMVPVATRDAIVQEDLSGDFKPGLYVLTPPTLGNQLGRERPPATGKGRKTGKRAASQYIPGVRVFG